VPADPSSSILSGLTPLCDAGPLRPAETPQLLAYLATITDPRDRAGRRHPLVAILVLAAAAVLAGARSFTAIAEWAADAPQPVRAALGARRDPRTGRWIWTVPTETTIRRTLARLDAEALAAAVGAWLSRRDHHRDHHDQRRRRRRAVAVDGKTLRGARRATDDRQVPLLAAMDHATRAVLAQQQVGGAPEEVPAFQPLLANLDLAGTVVTADALHTHPTAAEFLVATKQATTCSRSRPISPRCWTAAPAWPGIVSPSWTAPATAPTVGSRCEPSRWSRSAGSGSRMPHRSSRSPARSGTCASTTPSGGGP
jgi:hypothetical protein